MYIRIKYILYNLALPAQVTNLCIHIVLYRQYMHEVFHSFPHTSHSSAPTWWRAISCSEWWRWLSNDSTTHCALKRTCSKLWGRRASHIHIPSHILYTCSGDIYHYLLCTYMGHTDLYSQLTYCMAGNGTSTYNMHNTTVFYYVCTYVYAGASSV